MCSGSAPKLRAMAGSAVATTVLSRFCISRAHATMSAVSRTRRGPATGLARVGAASVAAWWSGLRGSGDQDGAARRAARLERRVRLGGVLQREGLVDADLHCAGLHGLEQVRGGGGEVLGLRGVGGQ